MKFSLRYLSFLITYSCVCSVVYVMLDFFDYNLSLQYQTADNVFCFVTCVVLVMSRYAAVSSAQHSVVSNVIIICCGVALYLKHVVLMM